MPYFVREKDGSSKEIPVKIVHSNDYKTYYAHGAQRGILGSYHFRIDFYREDIPPTANVIESEGKIKTEGVFITREIDLSIYMALPFAKQLRDWLNRRIEEFEGKYGDINIVSDNITESEK